MKTRTRVCAWIAGGGWFLFVMPSVFGVLQEPTGSGAEVFFRGQLPAFVAMLVLPVAFLATMLGWLGLFVKRKWAW